MRAYLRLDPHLPEHKAGYSDGAFRAFVEILCLGEQQPTRGAFKSERLLRVLLERRARWIRFLIAGGDLIVAADGQLYIDGWREWQEGDVTVPERMRRLRSRKNVTGVTPAPVTNGAPVDVTLRLAEAVGGKQSGERADRNGADGNPRTSDDPADAGLVVKLRRSAGSKNQQIAAHARHRLETMGVPLEGG